MAPRKQPLHAQLSPFLRGVVFGLFLAGSTYQEIADEVEKADGAHPCQQTVADTIRRVEKNGGLAFDGERAPQAGRPRHTDSALDRQILRLVFKHGGRAVVTARYVQKVIKAARKVSIRTLQRRLSDAGLAWLRRRRKSLVPQAHKVGSKKFRGLSSSNAAHPHFAACPPAAHPAAGPSRQPRPSVRPPGNRP